MCAPTVYKLGSQIDFSVFSAPLFGIFDVSQCTCSQNQCLFPFHLLVPLALLSNVYAATDILSMFSSSRLDLCIAILSNTASLWVPLFGAEHCREYCTVYEQNPSTMKCSRGQLRHNGACCARENVRVRFQLRTAFSSKADGLEKGHPLSSEGVCLGVAPSFSWSSSLSPYWWKCWGVLVKGQVGS